MTEATGPGDAFAIGNDEQYRPVQTVGAQRVLVSGPEGTGLLACDASGPLGGPQRGPVVVVVHGALRDSDRYLASARHAARLAASDALIVAPQFLTDVDRANGDRADDALYFAQLLPYQQRQTHRKAALDKLKVAVQATPKEAPDGWRWRLERAKLLSDLGKFTCPRRSLEERLQSTMKCRANARGKSNAPLITPGNFKAASQRTRTQY